ncbi:MAG: alkaline phosphatase family protein [Candidatus Heimdallarchaeota archaeon]|nr:alkaline phosphatase family protein [Candidatus Heimdallarchaeota archaeon]
MSNDSFCLGKYTIASITPTICQLMEIEKPDISTAPVIKEVIKHAKKTVKSKIEKCLIYAPDAIGLNFYNKYKERFQPIEEHSTFNIDLCSIFPPKTPVCFASMFTGAMPEVHGIKEYMKPVLKCETLFDAFIAADKKVALIAVKNSSLDIIFQERNMDYYSEEYDPEVILRTMECLVEDDYDLVVLYLQEYDDALHKTSPESETALKAVDNHIFQFIKIAKLVEKVWVKYNHLVIFTPDHGAHFDEEKGIGFHGENIPDDMLVKHFFTITPGI